MTDKIGFSKEKIWIAGLCAVSFLLHLLVINQFNGWFCSDTDGYWLHAATFTGYDWSGVAGKATMFYAWGYSLFLIIPILVTNDVLVLSKVAVVMNALFCALIIPLLYSIGKRIFGKANERILLTGAFITSLYSSYFLLSAVTLAESLLFFLYVLFLWLLVQYLYSHKLVWAVLCSISCGYMYIVHHRMIGMIAALFVMTAIRFLQTKDWRELICFLVPVTAMILLDIGVNHWLEIREMTADSYTTNTYGSMGKKVFRSTSIKGLVSLVQNMIGEMWYVLAGTFAVGGLGAIKIVEKALEGAVNVYKKRNTDTYAVFYWITVLGLGAMMAISAINGIRGISTTSSRIDLVFLGRYFENTVSILLFIGLVEFGNIREKQSRFSDTALLLGMLFGTSILVYYIVKGLGGNIINYFNVAAVFYPIAYPNLVFSVNNTSVCAFAICVFAICLFLHREKRYMWFAYLIITCGFLVIGYSTVDNVRSIYEAENASITNFPVHNHDFLGINDFISNTEVEEIYVYTEDAYQAFSFQMFHPDLKVSVISSVEELEQLKDACVILPKYVMLESEKVKILQETENFFICTLKEP